MKPSEKRDMELHKLVCLTLWRLIPKAMKELRCSCMCERKQKYAKK